MSTPTAPPEGVVARYLNATGTPVDVVDTRGGAQATCRGCDWSATSRSSGSAWDAAREAARRNAQGHAGTCQTGTPRGEAANWITQPPLTLADILTDKDGTIPAEQAAIYLKANWDIHMFIGHITQAEANQRLAAMDQTLSGLLTVRGDFTHRWAIFERHEDSCESLEDEAWVVANGPADDLCHCEDPWYARWVDAGTPGAIAVTTAFADANWDAEVSVNALTGPADQGLAAAALADLTRKHMEAAKTEAEAAHRQVEAARGQR